MRIHELLGNVPRAAVNDEGNHKSVGKSTKLRRDNQHLPAQFTVAATAGSFLRLNSINPCLSNRTVTLSPSLISPASNFDESWLTMCFWITRFNGLAPSVASYPSLPSQSFA